jgi:hypothetical protein
MNMHCFHTSVFSTLCFVLSAMDGKIEQRVCIKFWVKLGKSATETHEMLREAFGEHSLSRGAVIEWYSGFKACRVSVEDDERPGRPSSKTAENVEKIQDSSTKTIAAQSMLSQTSLDQLWSLPGDLNRKIGSTTTGSFIKKTRPLTRP